MLKQSGTGVTAVKQFVDKFEKLQGDQNQLEDALTSFGGQWDWLVATDQVAGGQPVVQTPVTVTSTQHLISSQQSLHSPPPDLTSPKVFVVIVPVTFVTSCILPFTMKREPIIITILLNTNIYILYVTFQYEKRTHYYFYYPPFLTISAV